MAGSEGNAFRLIWLAQYSAVTPESAFALIRGLDEYLDSLSGQIPDRARRAPFRDDLAKTDDRKLPKSALDQPAFNRTRLKAEKLIDSKVLEQLICVQVDAGCSSGRRKGRRIKLSPRNSRGFILYNR